MSAERKKHLQRLARKKAAYDAKKRQSTAPDFPIISMTRAAAQAAIARQQQVWIHGNILAFTTIAGDGWLLERTERWCMRLMYHGKEPIVGGSIQETEDKLIIAWGAKFRLVGDAFFYDPMEMDDEDPPATFPGYPVGPIQAWIDGDQSLIRNTNI